MKFKFKKFLDYLQFRFQVHKFFFKVQFVNNLFIFKKNP